LPKPETGYTWTTITKQMKDENVYKTLRTEWKKSRRFYEKLEAIKKKAAAPAKK
jgi:ribosomal protein S21